MSVRCAQCIAGAECIVIRHHDRNEFFFFQFNFSYALFRHFMEVAPTLCGKLFGLPSQRQHHMHYFGRKKDQLVDVNPLSIAHPPRPFSRPRSPAEKRRRQHLVSTIAKRMVRPSKTVIVIARIVCIVHYFGPIEQLGITFIFNIYTS